MPTVTQYPPWVCARLVSVSSRESRKPLNWAAVYGVPAIAVKGAVQATAFSSEGPHAEAPGRELTGPPGDPEPGGERAQTRGETVDQETGSGMLSGLFLKLEGEGVGGGLGRCTGDVEGHPAGAVHPAGVVLVAVEEHGSHGPG